MYVYVYIYTPKHTLPQCGLVAVAQYFPSPAVPLVNMLTSQLAYSY